jgi:sugar transferase (PEP-CTERM system associated)
VSFRFFQLFLKVPIVLLAAIEGALFFFAPYLASSILLGPEQLESAAAAGWLLPTALLYSVVCVASHFAFGLYTTRQRAGTMGLMVRVAAGTVNGAALSALIFFFVPPLAVSREVLGLSAAIAAAFSAVTRALFNRIVDQDTFKTRVLVYGAGQRASSLMQLRRRTDQRGFKLVGFMATEGDDLSVPDDRLLARPRDLLRWVRDNQIHEIIVAMDDRRRGFPVLELLDCRMAGIDILELPTFLERETGKVRLDVLNPSWIIFGEGFRNSIVQRALERGLDVVASALLLLLASPLMLLAMLAIKIEDGWRAPALYRQARVGRHNQTFAIVKFRSMRVDAEKPGEAIWATADDPRVTRVGAIMRKTRIDELPQLFAVLRGDMSFVGPRPERPEFVARLEQQIPYYRERHTVKPGITGWAQLCYPYGASDKDALEKLQYDLYYVKNRSLLFDLAILIQTVEVVLWGKGAR